MARDLRRVLAGLSRTAGTIMEAMDDGTFEPRVNEFLQEGNKYWGVDVSLVKVEAIDRDAGAITLSASGGQPWKVLFDAQEDLDEFLDSGEHNTEALIDCLPSSPDEIPSFSGKVFRKQMGPEDYSG